MFATCSMLRASIGAVMTELEATLSAISALRRLNVSHSGMN